MVDKNYILDGTINKIDWVKIQKIYNDGMSQRQIVKITGISLSAITSASKRGDLICRNREFAHSLCDHSKSIEHRNKISNTAKKVGMGGYRPRSGRSIKKYRNDSYGKKILLQSSYEIKLADLLNDNNIKWSRPSHIPYIKDNKHRKYFPDFLINEKIFIDTKNDYLIELDREKIKLVENQNNIKINIFRLSDINIKTINELINEV